MQKLLPLLVSFIILLSNFARAEISHCGEGFRRPSLWLPGTRNQNKLLVSGEGNYHFPGRIQDLDLDTLKTLNISELLLPIYERHLHSPLALTRLRYLLENPFEELPVILHRQAIVRELVKNQALREQLDKGLSRISNLLNMHTTQHPDGRSVQTGRINMEVAGAALEGMQSPLVNLFAKIFGLGALATAYFGDLESLLQIRENPLVDIATYAFGAGAYGAGVYSSGNISDALLKVKVLLQESIHLNDLVSQVSDPQWEAIQVAMASPTESNALDLTRAWDSVKNWRGGALTPFASLFQMPRVRALQGQFEKLTLLLSVWNELDVLLAAAKVAVESPQAYSFPNMKDGTGQMQIEDAHHPYVYHLDPRLSVPFSFELDSENPAIVLTGVNTGGKSTLLRAVSILAIQAQIGFPVLASQAALTPFTLLTNIGAEDDQKGGRSKFFAQCERIAELIKSGQIGRALFLLDEAYDGTSFEEIKALQQATIIYLIKNVPEMRMILATHTRALVEWAHQTPGIQNYFIDENHRLRRTEEDGPLPRNAFDIALRAGLPQELVQLARDINAQDHDRRREEQ